MTLTCRHSTFLLTLAALTAGVPAMALAKNTAVIECKQSAKIEVRVIAPAGNDKIKKDGKFKLTFAGTAVEIPVSDAYTDSKVKPFNLPAGKFDLVFDEDVKKTMAGITMGVDGLFYSIRVTFPDRPSEYALFRLIRDHKDSEPKWESNGGSTSLSMGGKAGYAIIGKSLTITGNRLFPD